LSAGKRELAQVERSLELLTTGGRWVLQVEGEPGIEEGGAVRECRYAQLEHLTPARA
jgi:hypothetical protein